MISTKIAYAFPNTENITRLELDNGLIILVYENHASQSVVLSGSLGAGNVHESISQNGLASITASALMQGTANFDFDQLHQGLENIGADLSISARKHRTAFGGKSLAEDLPTLIELLAEIIHRPTFPPDHIERLRGETLTWLQYSEQDSRYQAQRGFQKTLYPENHPYHYPVWGTLQSLPTISVQQMRDFHQDYYSPQGMILVVVGAVQTDDVIQLVQNYFSDWQAKDTAKITIPTLPSLTSTKEVHTAIAGKSQSDLIMGGFGPARNDEDYQAAMIANSILGEFGMMGRIGKVIREELGLAYYAYSRITSGHGQGTWSIFAGVSAENIAVTIERSLIEIEKMSNELVSDDDLADNQSYFTGRLPLNLESNEGIASNIHAMENYQLGLDYLMDYHTMIYSLSKEEIQQAVQHYWNSEAVVISVAGLLPD